MGSQDNPHHNLTLYEHLQKAIKCVDLSKCKSDVKQTQILMAAAMHDIGKAYTRIYDDKGIAHFYCHENFSAYLSMNMGAPMEVIQLINYHMLLYMDSRAQATWRERLGEEFWHELELLHEADVTAH